LVEHLTQQQFEDYCRQQLSVAELLLVSDDLGECEACRRRVEGAMNGDAAFFALRSELFGEAAEAASAAHPVRAHLTAEQTAAYVDGALSGETLRAVADHLATCEQCDLAVEDLRAFRDEVLPSLESEYQLAPVPAPAEGRRRRMAASHSALFRVSPAPAFGATLIPLVADGGGDGLRRRGLRR